MKKGSGYSRSIETQSLSPDKNEQFRNFEFVSPAYDVSKNTKNVVTDSGTVTSTETKTLTGTNTSSNSVEAAVYAEKLAQSNSYSPSRNKFQTQSPVLETRKFFSDKPFFSSSLSRSFGGGSQKKSEPKGLLHSKSIEPKKVQRFPNLFN